MNTGIERRIELCSRADDAEWEELVVVARHLGKNQKAFMQAHPPGLVRALWLHFAATRDRCGCSTAAHERAECAVPLIERLLLEADAA
jgi:hypothetical protein